AALRGTSVLNFVFNVLCLPLGCSGLFVRHDCRRSLLNISVVFFKGLYTTGLYWCVSVCVCVCVCVCVAYVLNPSVLPVFLLSSLCSVVHSIGMCGVVRL